MSYDGEVRENEWCSNHACYVWQCPKPAQHVYTSAQAEETP